MDSIGQVGIVSDFTCPEIIVAESQSLDAFVGIVVCAQNCGPLPDIADIHLAGQIEFDATGTDYW